MNNVDLDRWVGKSLGRHTESQVKKMPDPVFPQIWELWEFRGNRPVRGRMMVPLAALVMGLSVLAGVGVGIFQSQPAEKEGAVFRQEVAASVGEIFGGLYEVSSKVHPAGDGEGCVSKLTDLYGSDESGSPDW